MACIGFPPLGVKDAHTHNQTLPPVAQLPERFGDIVYQGC
jgi:hypothetical protein